MTLAAVIITKNEEKNIARCLDSILDVVDEVVVVDSFSTDATAQIVARYPHVQFKQVEWRGYSATKNYANSLVKSEYIISLDADECLSPALQKSLQSVKPGLNGVYQVKRLTNYCGKWIYHCGWYPDRKLRIFPKKMAEWNGSIVHEDLSYPSELPVTLLDGDLWHYSYYSIQEHAERTLKYATLGSQRKLHLPVPTLKLKSFVHPPFRFMRAYFLKLGFLDGYFGLVICLLQSYEVFIKYALAYEIKKQSEFSVNPNV